MRTLRDKLGRIDLIRAAIIGSLAPQQFTAIVEEVLSARESSPRQNR